MNCQRLYPAYGTSPDVVMPATKIAELRTILRGFAAANGPATVPGGGGKALEAWIFMRLAMAARVSANWDVTLRRGDGTLLPIGDTFAFATFQTGIQAAALSAPCYALIVNIANPAIAVELHGSLQWEGRSSATHEIDVSALPSSVASAMRAAGGGRPRGVPIVAIECKDKTSSGTPDEMRQTLGRMFDLALVTPPSASNGCRISGPGNLAAWGRKGRSYRIVFGQSLLAIARAGTFSSGARRLGVHYHIKQSGSVYDPAAAAILDLERKFLDVLDLMDKF